MTPSLSGKTRYLLFPLALFYWGAVLWRNLFYTIGFFVTRRLPVPVISVGNLTVGGTGKTPAVIYLAQKLQENGFKPAVLSRGYGRNTTGTVVVSDGDRCHSGWEDGGDEPHLMAKRLSGIPVVVDELRYRGGCFIVEKFHPDVILLDDAFQHRALARDLDIVLLNSQDSPEAYKMLPYGKLREPPFHLRRADVLIWTKRNLSQPPVSVRSSIERQSVPTLSSRLLAEQELRSSDGTVMSLAELKGKRVFAFCGVGDPKSFFSIVEQVGVDIVGRKAFDDHHHYNKEEMEHILSDPKITEVDYFITTEKDLFKVAPYFGSYKLYALGVEFRPTRTGEKELLAMVKEALG
jgi:tetraacyldisaccharide 4'-kinase